MGWDVFKKFVFAEEKLVEKRVEPGARSGGAGCVVDGGKRKVVFALYKDGGGGTVSPEFLGVGLDSRGRGDGNDKLLLRGVGWGELGARG